MAELVLPIIVMHPEDYAIWVKRLGHNDLYSTIHPGTFEPPGAVGAFRGVPVFVSRETPRVGDFLALAAEQQRRD